ncbi:MAG: hypothetical protein AB7S93_13925 [Xanthobacteraceae bacterium]
MSRHFIVLHRQHLHLLISILIFQKANAPPPGFCVGAGPPALRSSGPVRL